jgi:hypothetical protein
MCGGDADGAGEIGAGEAAAAVFLGDSHQGLAVGGLGVLDCLGATVPRVLQASLRCSAPHNCRGVADDLADFVNRGADAVVVILQLQFPTIPFTPADTYLY